MDKSKTLASGRLRVGLIGPGSIAERLITALSSIEDVDFWSVLGRDLTRTRDFATRHGAKSRKQAYIDLPSFLADPLLDAVIIATPDRLHAAQCIAAARARKHVFVEKPMATSVRDARRIVDTCRKHEVELAVGYHLRFHAGHQQIRQLVAEGAIGTIRHINVTWTMLASETDWRSSPELGRWWSLAALGTHGLDLVQWLVWQQAGEITTAKALFSNGVFPGARDETSLVSLAFESGATAQVLSSVVFRAPRLVEIFGTTGSIRCLETLGPRGAGEIFVNNRPLAFPVVDPYKLELTDFAKAIISGGTPSVDGAIGSGNVALLEKLSK